MSVINTIGNIRRSDLKLSESFKKSQKYQKEKQTKFKEEVESLVRNDEKASSAKKIEEARYSKEKQKNRTLYNYIRYVILLVISVAAVFFFHQIFTSNTTSYVELNKSGGGFEAIIQSMLKWQYYLSPIMAYILYSHKESQGKGFLYLAAFLGFPLFFTFADPSLDTSSILKYAGLDLLATFLVVALFNEIENRKMLKDYGKNYTNKKDIDQKALDKANNVVKQSKMSVVESNTDTVFQDMILRYRNKVIIQHNESITLLQDLINELKILKSDYEQKLYKKIYESEFKLSYYTNEINKNIKVYYTLITEMNDIIKETQAIALIPNYKNDPANSEFSNYFALEKDLLDFIHNKLEQDPQYVMIKSQLNMEDIKRKEAAFVKEEMAKQTDELRKQREIAERQLKSQLRAEDTMNVNVKASEEHRKKQEKELRNIQDELRSRFGT